MAAAAVMPYCFAPEEGDFSEFCHREFKADVYQHLVKTGICRDCNVALNDESSAREAEGGSREVRGSSPTIRQRRRHQEGDHGTASREHPGTCQCTSTQCWLLACVARSQTNTRAGAGLRVRGGKNEVCPFPPIPGSKFCDRCLCVAPGCTRRPRQRSRFCQVAKCSGKQWQEKKGVMDYVNQYGFHAVDPTWPVGLQVAAKWSWMLRDIPPLDYMEFRRLVQHVAGTEGRVSPHGFVAITLGHFLKWPAAVSHFRNTLENLELEQQRWSAKSLVDAFWHAVEAMDGQELPKMHASMSAKGRMHCLTGLVVHAQWLGILEKDDNTEGTAEEEEEEEEEKQASEQERRLQLGKGQAIFRMNKAGFADAEALVQLWIDSAPTIELEGSSTVVAGVAEAILEAVTAIRRSNVGTAGPMHWPVPGTPGTPRGAPGTPRGAPGTPRGMPGTPRARPGAGLQTQTTRDPGYPKVWSSMSLVRARVADGVADVSVPEGKRRKKKEEKPSYMASHFTRAVLLAMDESFWHIPWEEVPWTMSKVLRWTPDATDQCVPIAEMSLKEVVHRFGASPLWVSCWACFASGLSQDEVDVAMRTKDRDLQKVATRLGRSPGTLEECPDQFSPVVRDLLAQLAVLAE